jgi:hypothetical protein
MQNDHGLGEHSNDAKDRENAAFMALEERHAQRLAAAVVASWEVGFRCDGCGLPVWGRHGPLWEARRCSACLHGNRLLAAD